jgi:hypothetical protein
MNAGRNCHCMNLHQNLCGELYGFTCDKRLVQYAIPTTLQRELFYYCLFLLLNDPEVVRAYYFKAESG